MDKGPVESQDSDIDTQEIRGQLKTMQDALKRHFGHHKDVARLRSEDVYSKKEFIVVTPNLARATPSATILAMREELENERKRRMEQMADGVDEETMMTTEAKTGVHEELLHLFAFHDARYQAETEKLRNKVEEAKDLMHEELLRRSAQKIAQQEFEIERKRKLEVMEKMMRGEAENELEFAETNENLSKVQSDLKNAFKSMSKSQDAKNAVIEKRSEDCKEMILQDIRRKPAVSSVKEMTSKEQQRRISEYEERMRSMMSDSSRNLLVDVQEQLLGLFSKLKKDKKIKKVMQINETKERKARMQEELVRAASSKMADRAAAAERSRRISESKEHDAAADMERQETVELLLNVQKQLLDTCGHVQSQNLKHNVKQMQFVKARQNVLRDIRKVGERRASREKEGADFSADDCLEKGRKLSVIGEQFESKMKQ